MLKLFAISLLALLLSSCATIPTEYTSECACNYRPLNTNSDEAAVA